MEARFLRAAVLVFVAAASLGAGRPYTSVRSQHFIVSAPTPQLAQEICQAAEQFRRDLAIEWLGRELGPWHGPCPIQADVAPGLGAGGATSFVFQNNTPGQWTMKIQGSRERILDSVLPHEITHTIFATHFGRPLPRWADEGACTTVEHESEKAKQDKFLIQFLKSDRGIPFNQMFKMKDYPPDILPLYSQGYSLARFFIQQGGKPKFVEYVGEGMRTNNWTATTQKFYGFNSLSDLQLTWVEWVKQGSPLLADGTVPASLLVASQGTPAQPVAASRSIGGTQMASLTQQPRSRIPDGPRASWQTTQSQNARVFAQADQNQMAPQPANFARPAVVPADPAGIPASPAAFNYSQVSRPVSEGWYAKRRDQAQATLNSPGANEPATAISRDQTWSRSFSTTDESSAPSQAIQSPAAATDEQAMSSIPRKPIAAQPLTPADSTNSKGRVVFEWTRPSDQPSQSRQELTGVALHDQTTQLR
jgi:hypothetical protein